MFVRISEKADLKHCFWGSSNDDVLVIIIMIGTDKHHYQIKSERVVLKPYRREYVQEYHQWFTDDPDLLYLTGSEPLTL